MPVAKKYNDYDPGTYDTSKIFLQADATTGALEKIFLPVIPSISGLLKQDGSLPLTAAWNAGAFSIETKQTTSAANTINNGILLTNTTAAASGNQQYSPSILLEGRGWKTNAPAASQSVRFRIYLTTGQAAAAPTGTIQFGWSINGGGFSAGSCFLDSSNNFSANSFNTSGTNMTSSGFSGATIFLSGSSILARDGVGTTISPSITFRNGVIATAVTPQQYSPSIVFSGTAWNGSASQVSDFRIFNQPVNGTNPITSRLNFGYQIAAGGYSNFMTLTSSGQLSLGTLTPDASALLEINTTTKGFLPPRLTTTQKNAIPAPAPGLVVYDTTLSKLCVFTSAWETITSV